MALKTTVVGAYPKPDFVDVPDWFHNPDTPNPTAGWSDAIAKLGERAEATFTQGARQVIDDQVQAGVDVVTDGEIRRENYIHYHCRHLNGFDFKQLTNVTIRNGNYNAWLPTVRGKVTGGAPFLVHDWQVAQSLTDRAVKVTLPGPMTIADTTADAFYNNDALLGADLADSLNAEINALAQAGCVHIQIDEPVFARKPDEALSFGFENLERAFHDVPKSVQRTVHMCCGYPDRIDNPNYGKADRHAYRHLSSAIESSCIDTISLEDAHRHNDLTLLEQFATTRVIFGSVAVAQSRVESVDEIRERLDQALLHIDADRLIVAPDCGLGLLGRDLAQHKLRNMCAAARLCG